LAVLSGDTFTATDTITNPNNALGAFDNAVARVSAGLKGGDTQVWTISNFTLTGTVTSVTFSPRINATGFANDRLTIQYSNDSGTTWFNAQTGVLPPANLFAYGNYTVTTSFPSNQSIANMRVRLLYVQNSGPDNPTIGFDGVEVYITYTAPDTTKPVVVLNRPLTATWVTTRNVIFNFTASDNVALQNCTIYINGTVNNTNLTPSNGVPSYILVPFAADEDFLWNVSCYDTSLNVNTTPTAWVVKVDTLVPNVSLMTPLNNSVELTSTILFNYNVSDRASVQNCSLVIDDVVKYTNKTITKNTVQNMTSVLTNGDHEWYVNCTDQNGWMGMSKIFNISIQVEDPILITDKSSYEQGETVFYTGENWQNDSTVRINVSLPNGSNEVFTTIANATNEINVTRFIGYNYPIGTYTVFADQTNDSKLNASISFTVTNRTISITTDKSLYVQGQKVNITGLGFSLSTTVNLSIFLPTGDINQSNLSVNSSGGFNYIYVLNLSHPVGRHNLTGIDRNYSNLYANNTFNVSLRVTDIDTNKTLYGYNETVGIDGFFFSPDAIVQLRIYNTVTGIDGLAFPLDVLADVNGDFNYSWASNMSCSGNYTVLGEDQNITSYRANTTFIISADLNDQYEQVVEGITANRVSPVISAVNSSNDVRQVTGLSTTITDGYQEFSFYPGIPENASFLNVNITLEHRRTSNKVTGFQFYINKNGVLTLLVGSGCSGAPPDVDGTTICEVTGQIDNVSVANNLVIRVNYTRDGTGAAADAEVDFVAANYSWTGDPHGCFVFGSTPVPPLVVGVVVSPNPVVLNAGTTKPIECNFTVSDSNGQDDIIGANATWYVSPSLPGSADTNVSHYSNTSCTQTSSTVITKDYTCTHSLLYYAKNGSWTCNGTGISIDGTGFNSLTFDVDPLFALNVSDTNLSFGSLVTGQTSANIRENVTNLGNQPLNVTVYGYGGSPGDGNAFSCSVLNISIDYLRFAPNSTALYTEKINLSGSLQELRLQVLTQTTPVISTNDSYWQTQIPYNFSDTGVCNGTIVFHASLTA